MSARYLREQQVGFESQNIAYIRQMYGISSDLGRYYNAPLAKRPSMKNHPRVNQDVNVPSDGAEQI